MKNLKVDKIFIEDLFFKFCKENNLDIELSYKMPQGYETAFGTFDVCCKTLFINFDLLKSFNIKLIFNFFHELRHALQYSHPNLFNSKIQKSLPYVILYNGTCFKLENNGWKKCVISDADIDFENAYLNLPYEIDANKYAYTKTKELFGNNKELNDIFFKTVAKSKLLQRDLQKIFHLIDENIY